MHKTKLRTHDVLRISLFRYAPDLVGYLDFIDNLDFCKSIQHTLSGAKDGQTSADFEEEFCKR